MTTPTPACCPPGSIGMAKSHPEGTGTWITAEGRDGRKDMEFYVSGGGGAPDIASAERVVVVFTDVFGVRKGNHRVFADTLAEKLSSGEGEPKTCVVVPDLFRGNPANQPWFGDKIGDLGMYLGLFAMVFRLRRYYNEKNTVDGDILKLVIPFLKSQNPTLEGISIVGFCFGGWVIPKVLEKTDEGLVKSALTAHPAWEIEYQIYGKDKATTGINLAKGCGSTPLLMMPAKGDHEMTKPGSESLAILSKARGGIPETDISIEFPDQSHGFVSRGDPTEENIKAGQEKAMGLMVDFIKKHHTK